MENEEDAKSMVRKYILGTRSRHGKIASIMMGEGAKGPDDKGMWTIKGTYVTEAGSKEHFAASITSRGEVIMTNATSHDISGERTSKLGKR